MVQDKNTIKCDNLVLDTTGMKAIFVELKGTDLAHALQQINQTIDMMKEAVKIIDHKAIVEASGNVDLDTLKEIAATGVDIISSSAIVAKAPTLDLGLDS